jgi:hypothetical protein
MEMIKSIAKELSESRLASKYELEKPPRRPLRIFAVDPMAGRVSANRITIDVPNEELQPGPVGRRIEVIDYDGCQKKFYPPIDLDNSAVLMRGGLEPSESDPRFHQQMVYAVATRTLENFDRALGRSISLGKSRYPRLRLFPHAFHGANAFYSRDLHAVLFGYFRADRDSPGDNLLGQTVFTCLSHDIIVHEMTHAIVDRLRYHFLEASNQDMLAFHEGFADIVALFQHFTFPEMLRSEIQKTGTKLNEARYLVNLAQQFGQATGMGKALRSALGDKGVKLSAAVEPHTRGSVLVAAVFDGFFATYQRRIRDLIRIATGGSGVLPAGELHPDLVNRIAGEAARTAQGILTMCIRAFDYLPPVDLTFGDYLRALITADYELQPVDEFGQREAMVNAFRERGIFPDSVASLAEESLLWPVAGSVPAIPVSQDNLMLQFLIQAATSFGRAGRAVPVYSPTDFSHTDEGTEVDISEAIAVKLHGWANGNRAPLGLHPTLKIQVQGFHPVFRVAASGQLLIELVAQFVQTDHSRTEELGGIPFRGGCTVVAAIDGSVRYVVAKPMPGTSPDATGQNPNLRLDRQRQYLRKLDLIEPSLLNRNPKDFAERMKRRSSLANLHLG